jgi:hypothetical protein
MNVFNRIVLIFLCLALMAGSIAVIALAWEAPNGSIDALQDAVTWLDDNNQDSEKTILTAIAGAVAFVAFVLLLLELIPRSSDQVRANDLQMGAVMLPTSAISQRVEAAVRAGAEVIDVRAQVKGRRKGVLVRLDLYVHPDANLSQVTEQSYQATTDVLTERLHVSLLAPPVVRIHYRDKKARGPKEEVAPAEQPDGRFVPTQSAVAAAASAPPAAASSRSAEAESRTPVAARARTTSASVDEPAAGADEYPDAETPEDPDADAAAADDEDEKAEK